MPYVPMTPEERRASRIKAAEKAAATRAAKNISREPVGFLRISKSSIAMLNEIADADGRTQIRTANQIIKAAYDKWKSDRGAGGEEG